MQHSSIYVPTHWKLYILCLVYISNTFSLSIYLKVNIQIDSPSSLLCLALRLICECAFAFNTVNDFGHIYSNYTVGPYGILLVAFGESSVLYSLMSTIIYIPIHNVQLYESFSISAFLPTFVISVFFSVIVILTEVRWCLIVILICITDE